MNLGDLKRSWEAFGETDPFWAILTDPATKNNQWDPTEFFATGEAEVDCLMDAVAALSVLLKRGTALDFGCGVGRVTQALCAHFERCAGVDIAGSMIRLAREHNRFGDRCQYLVNEADNLRMFGDDHFISSTATSCCSTSHRSTASDTFESSSASWRPVALPFSRRPVTSPQASNNVPPIRCSLHGSPFRFHTCPPALAALSRSRRP
jgi:SAM-dependent methyltransferase